MKCYGSSIESKYIAYLGASNLYGVHQTICMGGQ